jgi:predicted lipoprotein DUF2279
MRCHKLQISFHPDYVISKVISLRTRSNNRHGSKKAIVIFTLFFLTCLVTANANNLKVNDGDPNADRMLFVPLSPVDSLPFKNNHHHSSRLWLVAGGHAALWAGTFVALNSAWYRDYPKSSFHFFDDRKEWKQMDKAGHVWTAYQLSRHSGEAWRWAGFDERKSAWLGGAGGFAFQSIVEILDGFSDQWGFSPGDMEANLIGSAGYVAQQLLFKNQVLQVKLGYKPYDYPNDLRPRRNELFGTSLPEQLLKDYNSQRYWLSANIKSVAGGTGLPRWLNIAIGYSADGIFGGHSNTWTDKQGNYFDRNDIKRVRHFYLSPDIDLTKIKTRSKLLRSVLFITNMIKIPAPAIEYNTRGKIRFHAFMF